MTRTEAKEIIEKYAFHSDLSEDEESRLQDAMEFMLEDTDNTQWAVDLGIHHYENGNYDLARKYYEMADSRGDKWAAEGLGYIWYSGHAGKQDYAKAFRCFSKAMENGNLRSMIQVAEMYRNGCGTQKDPAKYEEIIEEAYEKVKSTVYLNDPLPEVCLRLAKIRREQGDAENAETLLAKARDFLSARMAWNPLPGDEDLLKELKGGSC